eukprot:6149066-Pleurochrysis_carterae.AAC.1
MTFGGWRVDDCWRRCIAEQQFEVGEGSKREWVWKRERRRLGEGSSGQEVLLRDVHRDAYCDVKCRRTARKTRRGNAGFRWLVRLRARQPVGYEGQRRRPKKKRPQFDNETSMRVIAVAVRVKNSGEMLDRWYWVFRSSANEQTGRQMDRSAKSGKIALPGTDDSQGRKLNA